MLTLDWSTVFALEMPVLESVLRGTVVYFVLFVLLRLAGRRELGSLGVADLLILLLIADASGNAMSGGSNSLTDGLLVAATIVAWGYIVDWLMYRFPALNALATPRKVCVVRDGQLQWRNMRREFVTRDEILSEMRLAGIQSLEEVAAAYIEPNGKLSFLKDTSV
ncbi:DUF421 domain-containing protein [Alcaligenes nematophilus]|uniref:YetF domain-containing protein n=1 Tax=Alcaligenes phenolicus TaxID=232846 RepID=A0ABV2BIB1_9BURK